MAVTRVTQLPSGCSSQGPGRKLRTHSNWVISAEFRTLSKSGGRAWGATGDSPVFAGATWPQVGERRAQGNVTRSWRQTCSGRSWPQPAETWEEVREHTPNLSLLLGDPHWWQ